MTSITHISQYIQLVQSNGRCNFSFEELSDNLGKSNLAIRSDLTRLIAKKQVFIVRKGFYVIIPPEYSNMGILPVEFFIDYLMKHLKRDYYVGLLSAAMLHGAAHQQPQEYYIVTGAPKLRAIDKGKLKIIFPKRNVFPVAGIEQKKTETGFIKVSSPELTFLDLIHFEQYIGGLNKITTILKELAEAIRVNNLKDILRNDFPLPVFQRAGYIAQEILKNEKITSAIEQRLEKEDYRTVLLKTSGKKTGHLNGKWKVVVNTKIESDL